MRKFQVLALSFAFLLIPSLANANSITSTSPLADAILVVAPNAVSITTATPLMDQGNSVSVTDSMGVRVDDGSLAINIDTAVIGMKPLTATGVYTVTYTLLAVNEDPLTGTFSFTFNAPAVIAAPSSRPTMATLTATPAPNASTSTLIYALLIAALFVFLFLVWYAIIIFRSGTKKPKRK
ncbi:MAG: copper resistance protein CopC [Actinomycetes bacterium]